VAVISSSHFQSGALRVKEAGQGEWHQQALGRDSVKNVAVDSCSLFQLRISVLHPFALERVQFASAANHELASHPFEQPVKWPKTERQFMHCQLQLLSG
jgi:hypothetical protein